MHVNDIAKDHGGLENLHTDNQYIPFILETGLMYLFVKQPANENIVSWLIVSLTSVNPWNKILTNKCSGIFLKQLKILKYLI